MDWLDRMNKAMNYIEAHLTEDISFDEVAKIACCSTYHFQRMFSFITDVPISEYIRRRRLTLAAFGLQATDMKVIDIALKYRYDSPKAFSRAFKNLHGILPTSARNGGAVLKAYPRMTFQISIKGDKEMNYRIEKKEKFSVFGITTEICSVYEQPFIEIPAFWRKCDDDGTIERIEKAAGLKSAERCFGAFFNGRLSMLSYMLCYYAPQSGVPDGFEYISVPAKTWAIFPAGRNSDIGEISKQVKQIWKDIFAQWLPTSQYTLDGEPHFEKFYNLAAGEQKPIYTAEVWIPVKTE